jgi:hypothetical protein
MEPTSRSTGTGLTTLAAFGAGLIGLWNLLSGIAAVAKDDTTEAIGEVLFGLDISTWGWFWIVVGVVQIVTAVLIFQRSTVGQVIGIGWATISATLAVFVVFVAPIWALTVVGLNMMVIWALASDDDFGGY